MKSLETTRRPLFILEMANNHMGDYAHGLRIIREFGAATRAFGERFRLAFKFQYRQLDTFIHPHYRQRMDIKYVKRFLETELSVEQFAGLKAEAEARGFATVCTPFDEASVDLVVKHGYDYLKVASCSCTDWPLLEKVAAARLPAIVSCGGIALDDLDKVVSFFQHRDVPLTLMHCVAEYPTQAENLQLNQIDLLHDRYPGVPVGFSTHEPPELGEAVMLAMAKGAVAFEKHVGVPTPQWPLNAYSATPAQVVAWLKAAARTQDICGGSDRERSPFSEKELHDLAGLRRGVFAKVDLPEGHLLKPEDCLLAIPTQTDQLTANDLSKYKEIKLARPLQALSAVMLADVDQIDHRQAIHEIVVQVKQLLDKGQVVVPGKAELEISHHYGIARFREYGSTMITVVNRGYCKKLIVMLPGQHHPEQYHQAKEETFHVLHGEIELALDGEQRVCRRGDVVTVEKGVRHAFRSRSGAVMEEISSTHLQDDSFYVDPAITANPHRKTLRTYWLSGGGSHGD